MIKPEIPINEVERLNTLYSLELLDSKPEERFDRITRLAKRIFQVPIALVSIVDRDRQWFKSCVGLDASETPREISFCGHSILGRDVLVVTNATEDQRFADNPLVTGEPHIRFYAGCPIQAPNGHLLGTLCIIDQRPRSLSDNELEMLCDLAAMVEQEIAAVELATIDDLTQLANRRGFMFLAEQSLKFCSREKIPASLIYLDLNRFKQINDQFGHAEGDRALVIFANLLRETFRASDLLARLGGDEFVVFMAKTAKQTSEEILKRVSIAVLELNAKARLAYELSFSYGIVENLLTQSSTLEDLIANSDALMYQQKQEFRLALNSAQPRNMLHSMTFPCAVPQFLPS